MTIAYIAGAVVAALIVVIIIFKLMWRVAEPNEALIVSGSRHRTEGLGEGMGFRIVTGRGTLVLPFMQVVRKLSLDLNEAPLAVDCVTHQGIPLRIRGVVIFKVGDDMVSIANAARRFLGQQKAMSERVHTVFAGHLRSIVGGLTVENMIRDREKLTGQTRAASGVEMEKLGLIIDSLQIHEIDDPSGYIENLAAPHTAAVRRDARIAAAEADRLATQAEQEANARMAEATRESEILQAGYRAETEKATATARQSGPRAEAEAQQEVVVQETRVAELVAARREQQLQADVRRPADAQAYERRTLAEAERDAQIAAAQARAQETELRARADAEARRLTGQAEADAIRATGLAEADATKAQGLAAAEAIRARAEALSENQEAVVAQQLAEHWPEIVEAGAKALSNVDHMVVLNGAEGVSELFAKSVALGGSGLGLARQLMNSMNGDSSARNGHGNATGAAATGAAATGDSADERSARKAERIVVTDEEELGA